MKFLLALLPFGFLNTTTAWTVLGSRQNQILNSNSKLMASRSADKALSRQAWAEKKGISDETEDSSTSFCTVVGGGRIGSLLAQGDDTLLLKRGDSIPSDNEGTPILIATRNDSLDQIIEDCPENRLKDLTFLQNGYLDGYLEEKGLAKNTQALLYLSVPALGVEPVDGITSVNPEGLTAAVGVHAQAFADRLGSLGLECNVVSPEEYQPAMFEKLIWISTYMLVGTAKECKSVGQAGADHTELVETVVNELVAAVSEKEGIKFSEGSMARLAAYTDVVADFPCAVKEFEWRNEYFYKLGDEACPTHNGLLRECKEKGLLGFELP
mmetsp:Transcript_9512/g.14261  ORF Transcript_9512/g.14261 Transcript_9512/m.14261 type:complete len:325 (+) Transcript_9512:108-1082(+)|eukprot:CAMPEP_0194074584 /NCGR_PEP_ID=MMETSP0149-20130528/1666_1 /TAXON_ID=122233 /ORGANISM="Chaetoceros debilis, Strain MM31A-1" /LENGTH=324 /DNA_ID=CAMNT_0038754801 /DNA_START=40 /DNA_END=1014 /DNA_ORIENTATION=-